MGLSYTTTVERELRSASPIAGVRIERRHALLPLTSLVAMMAIGLAYAGRTQSIVAADAQAAVNLNAIADVQALDGPLASAFPTLADRQLAARSLLAHITSLRSDAAEVSHVGALAAARIPAATIDQTPRLAAYRERLDAIRQRAARAGTAAPVSIAVLSADDLSSIKPNLVVRTAESFREQTLTIAAGYFAGFFLVMLMWWITGKPGDPLLLAAAHLLTAIGFAVMLARPDPLRDVMLVARYSQGVGIGLVAMMLTSHLDFRKAAFLKFCYVPLLAALLLSTFLMIFGHGPGSSTAKVNLGPVQPVEAIRLLLALFLAGYFARRWELLREVSAAHVGEYRVPRWVHVPRADYALPVLVGVMAALMMFFLQKDLGPALLLSCSFLVMYAVATARTGMAVAGCGLLFAGFYAGYRLNVSTTLANRIGMWQSPWDNVVSGGDQVAQSIWALSTGGFFGVGLGFGDTRYVPAGATDLVLAAIGEELGALGLLAVALVYFVLTMRALRIGVRAANDYGYFLAMAVTLFLVVPVLVMAAGTLGVTPLTGVVTPFLSYGGSAMVANFAALGMLMSIQGGSGAIEESQPFRVPTRFVGGGLAVTTAGLLLFVLNVQVVRADDYLVKPHLSVQADGVRRYQYNQRVLDVARLIPRGTIFDRRGVPLATSDPAVLAKAQQELRALTPRSGQACKTPFDRCYPLEGVAFHVVGDVTNRTNWAASNSSYLERDAESRLRGFDDHEANVTSPDANGRPVAAVRRDYRELIPLLRHRHDRGHPDVKRLLLDPHDLRVTLDARLQDRVAAVLSQYAARSATGRAAAVVIDVSTGALLASVSYPWPSLRAAEGELPPDDSLLDRARYGLYPPGSTFKLVTAAAALRQADAWSNRTFMCSLLPGGRVGARVSGWSKPVRDDVLDRHPHGKVDMHEGVVQSCNAYFAQLAVRLGPQPLLETASKLGISVAPGNSERSLKASLAHAGYGQGDVVATPLRMARVAAAIANGGLLRDVRLDADAKPSPADRLVSAGDAARLGRYMRDAVLNGSGRRLKDHPWRIAGKTGTGEVTGQPSHAWFVGFAPYGSATKRIAFAVLIENAGYGGLAAAPAAGEIVSAAAARGLIQ